MVDFNNSKKSDRLLIEIEIKTYRIDFKTTVLMTREEVLDETFTVDKVKEKLIGMPKNLVSKDWTRIVNHCLGSYHDYKRFLKN